MLIRPRGSNAAAPRRATQRRPSPRTRRRNQRGGRAARPAQHRRPFLLRTGGSSRGAGSGARPKARPRRQRAIAPPDAASRSSTVDLVDPRRGTHRLGRLKSATPGEHRQAGQHALLVWAQQVIGPVDRGAQRGVTFDRAPLASREHAEPVIQPLRQLRRAQHRDAGRGQLQRQRDPIEAPNDLGDRSRVGVGHLEVGLRPPPRVRRTAAPRRCSTRVSRSPERGSPSDGTATMRSPAMPRPSRLVASTTSSRAATARDRADQLDDRCRGDARSCRAPATAALRRKRRPAWPSRRAPGVASPRTPPRPRRRPSPGRVSGPAPRAMHRHRTRG